MKRTTCAEFSEACEEQFVRLRPPHDQPGFFEQRDVPVDIMVKKTARLLKMLPRRLTHDIIDLPLLPDTESNILAAIINGTMQAEPSTHPFYFPRQSHVPLAACAEAEGRFARTFIALEKGHYDGPSLGGNILLKNGAVCALQKSVGENSAMTLVPIVIDGVPYPAGSLVNVGTEKDPLDRVPGTFSVRELGETGLGFNRLTALAVQPHERDHYELSAGGSPPKILVQPALSCYKQPP